MAAARVCVRGRKPDDCRFDGCWPAGDRRGFLDDRIWYSDQCVQPGQHAYHCRHDRGRRRLDPDRAGAACSVNCGGSPKRSKSNRPPAPPTQSNRGPHSAPRLQPEFGPAQPSMAEAAAAEPPRAPEPPYAPEPRFPATASEPAPGPLDWLRAKSKPVATPVPSAPVPPAMSEPPMVELTDEAPLSPRSPQRPAMPPAVDPRSSRRSGRRAVTPLRWSPGRHPGSEQPMPRATRRLSRRRKKKGSISVWPDRGAPAPQPSPRSSRASLRLKRSPR